MLKKMSHFAHFLNPLKTGSFATVGLHLLDPLFLLGLTPQELALENDISGFLQNKLKAHWATKTDFDEVFFKAACLVVAGALDPRPTHRWTPARTLEELDNIGTNLTAPHL